jgi:hypothetical protein
MATTQQAISFLHADLDKQQQRYVRLECELRDAYKEKEKALQKEREDFELSTQRINTTMTTNKIKLKVGGRIFSVTLDMMLKYPESFFALFSRRWEDQIGSDGVYFINRSFQLFHHIVDFLRDGGLDVELGESDHRALCREADFYQLKELVDVLNPPPSEDDKWTFTETPNGELSNGGLTLTKKTKGDWNVYCVEPQQTSHTIAGRTHLGASSTLHLHLPLVITTAQYIKEVSATLSGRSLRLKKKRLLLCTEPLSHDERVSQ